MLRRLMQLITAASAQSGHELIHGYDDQGRKFNAEGNLRDWWTSADATAYEQRDNRSVHPGCPGSRCEREWQVIARGRYSRQRRRPSHAALQSTLQTQGKMLDTPAGGGLTQAQTFSTAYATVWCGELRPEAACTAVLTQGHSLNRYRANNVVANMPEFAHAFGCKPGQKRVRENACRVW